MGWVRLDDRRALNVKLRRAGFAARGLDECAMCQVAADKTDGFVADDTLKVLATLHRERNVRRLAAILVREGRWARDDVRGGYWIHDYLDFNPSKADDEARQLARSNAGHKGGKRSGEVRAASSKNEASASPVVEPRPDPTRTRPILSSDYESEFLIWYDAYPKHEAKGEARKAYAKARGKTDADSLLAGAKRLADDPQRDPKYTKQPATWLNQECWDDERGEETTFDPYHYEPLRITPA